MDLSRVRDLTGQSFRHSGRRAPEASRSSVTSFARKSTRKKALSLARLSRARCLLRVKSGWRELLLAITGNTASPSLQSHTRLVESNHQLKKKTQLTLAVCDSAPISRLSAPLLCRAAIRRFILTYRIVPRLGALRHSIASRANRRSAAVPSHPRPPDHHAKESASERTPACT